MNGEIEDSFDKAIDKIFKYKPQKKSTRKMTESLSDQPDIIYFDDEVTDENPESSGNKG